MSGADQSVDRRLRLVAGTDVVPACEPYMDPTEIWPDRHAIDAAGATLARDMLLELRDPDTDSAALSTRDYCDLEDWARQGRPFRNIVLEYLERARLLGEEAETGFCAALTDFTAYYADPHTHASEPDDHIKAYVPEVQS